MRASPSHLPVARGSKGAGRESKPASKQAHEQTARAHTNNNYNPYNNNSNNDNNTTTNNNYNNNALRQRSAELVNAWANSTVHQINVARSTE
eukprot:8586590-Pyramimonas_sp.AAC.1